MNLTISVNPEVLKRARIRALRENSSVNAFLGEQLRFYANGEALPTAIAAEEIQAQRQEAIRELLRLAEIPRPLADPPRSTRDSLGNRTWTRDELHER